LYNSQKKISARYGVTSLKLNFYNFYVIKIFDTVFKILIL
jgi:hypothetical protein